VGDVTTLGIRYEDWRLRPHGTLAAYRRHYRRGTPVCEACRQAKARSSQTPKDNAARRERYAQARAAGMSWRDADRARDRRAAA
jgi:hypothetical protein